MARVWTDADLEAIDEAIIASELLVDFGHRKIRYKNQEDMFAARAFIVKMIKQTNGEIQKNKFPYGFRRTQTCRDI